MHRGRHDGNIAVKLVQHGPPNSYGLLIRPIQTVSRIHNSNLLQVYGMVFG